MTQGVWPTTPDGGGDRILVADLRVDMWIMSAITAVDPLEARY